MNYALAPHIPRLASFAYQNLVDDVPPAPAATAAMDVVLCRNVLMYFEADAIRVVLDKFRRALVDDGWLVVSPTEGGAALLSGFTPVGFENATLYRKGGEGALPPPPPLALPMLAEIAAPPALAAAESDGGPDAAAAPPPAVPDTKDAYRRALACYTQGDYATAVTTLAAIAPDDLRGLTLAAHACANQGRLDEACHWCAAAVAADKLDPGLRYLLASILSERGRYRAAIAVLKQALYLDHDFVLAHFALGNLHRRLGQHALAARHFAAVRELLAGYPPDLPLPDAEGLTAGRLLAIIDHAECIA